MKIDLHTHTFPAHKAPQVLDALTAYANSINCPLRPHGDGTLADLLRRETAAGIDRFAICPIATRPEQHAYMLKFLGALRSGACGEEARTRVIPAASVHPDVPDPDVKLAELKALGLKLIKLHPYFQKTALNDPKMIRLLRACAEADIPVLCHTGGDVTAGGPPMATPAMILEVTEALPELRLICAHCAAWDSPESLDLLLGKSIRVDLSCQTFGDMDTRVRRFAEEHPQDCLFFGSDWPWADPGEHAARIASWDISPERLAAIMGGNAQALLRLTEQLTR